MILQHAFFLKPICFFLSFSQAAVIQDFHTLRAQAESDGLFRAQPLFFCLHLGHILLLEALAWLIIWLWGTSWTLTFLISIILATAQVTPNVVISKLTISHILLQTDPNISLPIPPRRRPDGCSMTSATCLSSRSPAGITFCTSLSSVI